jgi:hypothetical protein
MPTDYEIVQTMEQRGGSFVRALAAACHCADPVNFAKIKATWPDYFEEYAEMHEQAKQRERDWSQA